MRPKATYSGCRFLAGVDDGDVGGDGGGHGDGRSIIHRPVHLIASCAPVYDATIA